MSAAERCPDCGLILPVAHEARPWRPAGCEYVFVRDQLSRQVSPWTEHDDRMARWLAGLDGTTIEWVLSLTRRAISGEKISRIASIINGAFNGPLPMRAHVALSAVADALGKPF
jgi:hypothetical protein